jgi:ribosomal protein L37AE/L43A
LRPQINKPKKNPPNTSTSRTKFERIFVCFECSAEFTQKTALHIYQIYLDANGFPHGLGHLLSICCPKCRQTNYHPKSLNVLYYECEKCGSEFSVRNLWWKRISLVDDQGSEVAVEQQGICPHCQHTNLHPTIALLKPKKITC